MLPAQGAVSNDNTLQILNASSGRSLTSISFGELEPAVLAWSPDGQSIAVLCVNGMLQVWSNLNTNLNTDQNQDTPTSTFSQPFNTQQNQLAWSPDGHFLALIDDTNNVLVLDRSSGSVLAAASIADSGVFPGQALIWLDSQHIAVANSNMKCWVWSLDWF
jgi:WD40 repeat protein